MLIGEELLQIPLELAALRELLPVGGIAGASRAAARNLKFRDLRQVSVLFAAEKRLFDGIGDPRVANQHDLARQFPLVLLEVRGRCGHQLRHLSANRTIRPRRPGFR